MPEVRLVDSETLKSRIGELCINNDELFSAKAYERIIGVIEAVQKIEAAPVRHGTWKFGYNPEAGFLCYFCSACGKEAYWDTDYGQQRFDFCPKCGADMRGGC